MEVDTQVMQRSLKDPNLPVSIRLDFVRKVYSILICMLGVSFSIVAPFVYDTYNTLAFLNENQWIISLCMLVMVAQQMLNLAMAFEGCCGGGPCTTCYFNMMKTVPWNYLFLFSYSAAFGVVLGAMSARYTATSVGCVFLLTAGIMIALTVYAVKTQHDFTGMGAYFVAMMAGFCLLILLGLFIPGPFIHKLIAGAGAVLFSFVIIYDTQLIFGTATVAFGRSPCGSVEFSVDMYAFAAYQLYLDFVNMFIYLLELFGERRDS